MRLVALLFAVIYHPYTKMIEFFNLISIIVWLNCTVMIRMKKHQIDQCANYLKILKYETPTLSQNLFDFHFYKMAVYTKFASLLT